MEAIQGYKGPYHEQVRSGLLHFAPNELNAFTIAHPKYLHLNLNVILGNGICTKTIGVFHATPPRANTCKHLM